MTGKLSITAASSAFSSTFEERTSLTVAQGGLKLLTGL